MGTRKRGAILKTPDEVALDRRERGRQEPPPASPSDSPSTLPPDDPSPVVTLPFLGSVPVNPAPVTIGDFALNLLMAQQYAKLARDGGMLDVHTSDAQATLLVMRGFEMGVAPLRALNELYLAPTDHGGLEIVEEATLIRARVAKSGLGVIEPLPEHCNETIATIRAIRKDHLGRRETLFRYTIDDATHDGLMLKANWQSGANREALLTARATTKAARAWFSDVEGERYTGEELGGGGSLGEGLQARQHTSPPPPTTPAPVTEPAGVAAPVGDEAGATDAGGTTTPVSGPTTGAAAAAPQQPPSSPPPPASQEKSHNGPGPGATRQEKMAYYASVSQAMNRPWTSNVGMSRDAQPVPIITHGVTTDQITTILNFTVKGRTDFARADEALQLVVDHLGTLGIDTQLCPPPYCFFALSQEEAKVILQGLDAFAQSDARGDEPISTTAPPNAHDLVPDGQSHSWNQANDYLEAVLRRLVGHASRAEVLGMIEQATAKTFYELQPDELYGAAADLDRLGKNPTILKQAIDRMRIARGA